MPASQDTATALARESPLPSAATPLDSRLVALLSSPYGPSLKPSIWSILENIHRSPSSSPTHVASESLPFKGDDEPATPNVYPNHLSNDSFSDASSIMVYSPLFPTQSDIVELAELVDTDPGEDVVVNSGGDSTRTQDVPAGRASWTLMWPFSKWHRKNQPIPPSSLRSGSPQQQSAEFTTSSQVGTNNVEPTHRTAESQRTRRWVPSSSKISLQIFWWGYRLYIPPPILEILNDRAIKVQERAEAITGALTWLFRSLPVNVFPDSYQPLLLVLPGLVPLLGSIGTFIVSWAWAWITNENTGCGVTLTALWLLPGALYPGTWHENDFPKSPTPSSPIPLPRYQPFSMESFDPPTPAVTTTTMTDNDTPSSAYATPMSSIISLYPMDMLSASSTAWSGSPPPPPLQQHLISSPIHYPTSILPNSPNNHSFTPNSLPTTPVPHQIFQNLPSTTSSVPFPSPTTLPSPRIRKPRYSTRMGSFSPFNNNNTSSSSCINPVSPHLIINNNPTIPPSPPPIITRKISTSTPIPVPPTPIDLLLPPIPPEPELQLQLPLANPLLYGPVLETVPLPDVE